MSRNDTDSEEMGGAPRAGAAGSSYSTEVSQRADKSGNWTARIVVSASEGSQKATSLVRVGSISALLKRAG